MILAGYISAELTNFPKTDRDFIKDLFISYYGKTTIENDDIKPILELLKYDKKNSHGNINFVLLEAIGKPKIDCIVDEQIILNAFKYYAN